MTWHLRLIPATDSRNANECTSMTAIPVLWYCTAQSVLDFQSPCNECPLVVRGRRAPSSDSSLAPEGSRLIDDGAWPALGLACTTDAGRSARVGIGRWRGNILVFGWCLLGFTWLPGFTGCLDAQAATRYLPHVLRCTERVAKYMQYSNCDTIRWTLPLPLLLTSIKPGNRQPSSNHTTAE